MRAVSEEYVFTYKGRKLTKMYGRAWRDARERAGLRTGEGPRLESIRSAGRLRAAGVSFEDRQDLLGHKSGRVTTHDSRPNY